MITPGYLAAVIAGSWNSRLQAGTTIQRAPIRDLEVPLIPKDEQSKVVLAQVVVSLIREQSEQLNAQAREVQRAILDALRYNIPLDLSDFVGRHGHDAHDDEKDNK